MWAVAAFVLIIANGVGAALNLSDGLIGIGVFNAVAAAMLFGAVMVRLVDYLD